MKRKPVKDLAKYSNEWVAIDRSKGKIIAHSFSFDKLWKALKQKAGNATFYKVPSSDSVYAP